MHATFGTICFHVLYCGMKLKLMSFRLTLISCFIIGFTVFSVAQTLDTIPPEVVEEPIYEIIPVEPTPNDMEEPPPPMDYVMVDTSIVPDSAWLDQIENWSDFLDAYMDTTNTEFKRTVLSVYIRPQTLLHRYPALVGGVLLRPTKRLGLVAEYGYGLDYSIFRPLIHGNQVSERYRGAILWYKKRPEQKKHGYRGFEGFYFPLQYFSKSTVLRTSDDWFTLTDASMRSNSWGFGYVSGSEFFYKKRFPILIESSIGAKFRDNRVLSEGSRKVQESRISNGFLTRPFKSGDRVLLYYTLRVHFGLKLIGKKVKYEEIKASDVKPERSDKLPRIRI
jgi:hypothetical protein